MKLIDYLIGISLILTCVGVWGLNYKAYQPNTEVLGGHSTFASVECTASTSTKKYVGNSTSNGIAVVLEANSRRAWARIQAPHDATNTYYLAFNGGTAASLGTGVVLNGFAGITTGGTSTDLYIDFGRNTDFPYAGTVTGITSNAVAGSTTTLNVTECIY